MDLRDSLVQAYDGDGEPVPSYTVRPVETGTYLGVIVIHGWWGLDEHVKDVARRFAREGFVALAPDLYRGRVARAPDEARALARALGLEAALADLRTCANYLLDQQDVRGPTVGVVGFCIGGNLALRAGCASRAVGAVVDFYGRPPDRDTLCDLVAPVLAIYGEADASILPDSARALEATLRDLGKPAAFHCYPGAPHAFFNDTRPSYRPDAAADAWQRTLAFLRAVTNDEQGLPSSSSIHPSRRGEV